LVKPLTAHSGKETLTAVFGGEMNRILMLW
jgi:hypothetical protein